MARNGADSAERWLTDLPPTPGQTWSAVAVAAVVLIAFAAVLPFSGIPLARLNILFPLLDSIVFVTDLVTAVLLFAQFSISRSRSLLALANGYLFTALIVVPHALTFSGAFSPTGLLGANIQTGSWLFIFWHLGFAAALLAYAVLRTKKPAEPVSGTSALPAIGWSVAGVLALVCGLTWLATAGATLLPAIVLDQTRISPFVVYPISFTILISAAALAALVRAALGARSMAHGRGICVYRRVGTERPVAQRPLQCRLLRRARVLARYGKHCPDRSARRDDPTLCPSGAHECDVAAREKQQAHEP